MYLNRKNLFVRLFENAFSNVYYIPRPCPGRDRGPPRSVCNALLPDPHPITNTLLPLTLTLPPAIYTRGNESISEL